jgi:hypothetical protein
VGGGHWTPVCVLHVHTTRRSLSACSVYMQHANLEFKTSPHPRHSPMSRLSPVFQGTLCRMLQYGQGERGWGSNQWVGEGKYARGRGGGMGAGRTGRGVGGEKRSTACGKDAGGGAWGDA